MVNAVELTPIELNSDRNIEEETLTCYLNKKVYAIGSDDEVLKSIRAYISTMDTTKTNEVTFTIKRGFPKREK